MKRVVVLTLILASLSSTAVGEPIHHYKQPAPRVATPPLVSAETMEKWTKVAQCETHQNWHRHGDWHDGGLGILEAAWRAYGGLEYAERPADATPEEQVLIATRINAGYEIPDQDGRCRAW